MTRCAAASLLACAWSAYGHTPEVSRPVVVEPPVAELPSAWRAVGPASENNDESLELLFMVKQEGLQELLDVFDKVSAPQSPAYGQHLSLDEVNALTAPRPANIAVVEAFLRDHGTEPRCATPNCDMISAKASVEVAERLLSTSYTTLVHDSGIEVMRTLQGYSLPSDVAAAVDFVAPTTHVPGVRQPTADEGKMDEEPLIGKVNSPKNLRQLYNVKEVVGKADGNKQAVTAFLEQGYKSSSLQKFWDKFCDGITCGKGLPNLVGDATGGSAGIESMLDIETITGIAGNVESEFWGFSGRSPDNPKNEPFLKWLEKLSSTGDDVVPKIFSTSYGEDEGSWSLPAANRLNVEFQKAGVRGISLLFASGDEGANCKGGKFVAEGPGSSPYVTAVGGTTPATNWPNPGDGAEHAVGLSSGGFSAYWPMPDWQKDAVGKYLKQAEMPDPKRGYNTSGRAYPDIAAQATNFFVWGSFPTPGVAGTSCASPAAAGLFALLNDVRLQQGKSTLGFLNPFIYEHAAAFNDITEGRSEGCQGDSWKATDGWDAVTGVGTPDYAKLSAALEALPAGRSFSYGTEITV